MPLKINIVESPEVLAQLLEQENDKTRYKKLRMLYLLKTEKVKAITQVAQIVERHPTTLHSWIKAYRQGGLEECLRDGNDRFSDIPEWVIDRLIEKFQTAQFLPPIRDIQHWLLEELGVSLKYGQVQRLLRFKVLPKQEIHRAHPDIETCKKVAIGEITLEEFRADIYEQFLQWKDERGFPSNEQAINQLMGEFFELRTTHEVSPFQQSGKTLIESLAQGALVPNVPYYIPNLLIQNRLAERLHVDDSTLSRERGKRTFPGWTKQRDSDGVGWLWVSELKKYRPLLSIEEIKAVLLSPN